MRRPWLRYLPRYAIATACAALALFVTGLLAEPLGGVFFVIPLAAITVVALAFGSAPGLFATLLVTLGLGFGVPLAGSHWPIAEPTAASRMASFVFAAVVISAIAGRQRVIRERLRQERASATDAAVALHEADLRKNEFLAMLSHELRNPLAPIHNGLYLLRKRATSDAPLARTLGILDRQVSHLTRLIDELLDVTRISRGKIKLQRSCLDLGELVGNAVDDYRPTLADRGIDLEMDRAPGIFPIVGDATRLVQAVGNLLSNAAKFTPAGGRVRVSLRSAGKGTVVFEVADDGSGLEASMLERIFEPFVQADRSLDRSRGGLGLGLALVKGLVELHGGRVRAASDGLGRGARFTVELPYEARCTRPQTARLAADGRAARSVLIIEDNRDAADTMRDALALRQHRVDVAYDGMAGLAKARALRPDVVLCDIGLPGMDGYSVARAISADSRLAGTRLVAVTGYAQPEDQHKAFEAGFHRHVAKPASPETLAQVIGELQV